MINKVKLRCREYASRLHCITTLWIETKRHSLPQKLYNPGVKQGRQQMDRDNWRVKENIN